MIEQNTPEAQSPLLRFTLRGQAARLDQESTRQVPLLGTFCLMGQGTVLAAPPNAGKTLITLALLIEAIEEGRIRGEDAVYVDADDSTQGVAEKVRLLDEFGVHVVAEGYNGFRAGLLAGALEEMIADGSARGKFLILDTFKKFTQLMDKRDTGRFTAVARRFVLTGGTLLCLSHTNKHQDANGRNVFAGVSDIIDDLDCAYVVDVKPGDDGERVATFTNKKRRGNVPDALAYAYSQAPEISYVERLTSVHKVDARIEGEAEGKAPDEEILESIALTIHHGRDRGKMEIVRMVSGFEKVSRRRVLKLLEAHTGDDPAANRWRHVVRAHGKFTYELLGPPPGAEA